jgi:hypothetical protein
MRIRTSIALIIVGAVLLAAGLALDWLSQFLASSHLRRMALEAFGKSVNATLEVQRVEVDLPATVHLSGVSLTAPSGGKPVFECPSIEVDLRPSALLTGRVVPRRVILVSPVFRLLYSAEDKAWNVESISRKGGKGAGRLPAGLLEQGVTMENATLMVSDEKVFGDAGTRTFEGLYGTGTQDSSGMVHFDGGSLLGPLAGLRFSGWLAPGKPPRLNLQFNDTLTVDRAVWWSFPFGASIWGEFQPTGTMAASGQFSLDRDGRLLYSVQTDLRDTNATAVYYPFPVHSISGTVVISNNGVVVKDLSGIMRARDLGAADAPAELANFRVSGSENRETGAYLYTVQAYDVPLTRQAIEAVPEVGKEVWQRAQPQGGTCQVAITLSRPRHGAHSRFRAEVALRAASLKPAETPLPLSQVNGTVIVDNDAVQLQNLSGIMAQDLPAGPSAAHFRVQGLLDLHARETSLDVTVDNLHSTEQLVKAIPVHGEAIWRIVQPQVTLDGALSVQTALIDVHGGKALLDFWPMPVYDVSGTLKLTGSTLMIERVGGSLHLANTWDQNLPASTQVSADGTVDLKAESAQVHVSGRDVLLGEELLRSIPIVGQKIWQEARPAGVGTLDGQIVYSGKQDHPFHCFLDVGLQDVAMIPGMIKTPMDAVAGHVLVTENQAFSNGLAGLVCGGHFTARAVAYYGPQDKYPRFSASATVDKLDVARLADDLTGNDQGVAGELSGWVDMGGVYGQEGSTAMAGHVSLTNGHLMDVPFFAQLLNVLQLKLPGQNEAEQAADLSFTRVGDTFTIQDFEFTGGGLSLSGAGTIKTDGSLKMTLIAVGAPTKGGIPIISSVVDWLLSNIERQLVRVEVTGTLSKPEYHSTVLSTITWPLRSLRSLLVTPILGGGGPATPPAPPPPAPQGSG